jgi:uncharacterized membrane protein SpoIIM required for sporulation
LLKVDHGGLSDLGRDRLRELGRLYRAVSADLSRARALNIGGDTQIYLNNLVVKGHNQVYQRDQNRWADLWNFFWVTFPSMVRERIIYVVIAFAIFLVPLVGSYLFVMNDLEFAHLEVTKGAPLVPEQLWSTIEKQRMWTESTQEYSPLASSAIAANNIRVAILSFAYGITFAIGTVYVLFMNGMMIGTIFGACHRFGIAHNLLSFVAPHGVLELTAIFISGGAGLMLGKAMLFPGRYKRSDALRLVAKPALGLFGGCIPMLLMAGTIEGFLSPRTDVSAEEKFGIGLATMICLLLYLFAPRLKEHKRIK